MKAKKLFQLLIGFTGALLLIIGFVFIVTNSDVAKISGGVVLGVNLISGLIIPNPVSIAGFFAGLFMLILPAKAAGVVLVALGAVTLAVPVFWQIKSKRSIV
ncbi:MAG: hypothetical protein IJD93_03695 [Ruminococcus sp.]|nr:hypothetical protein [Ruminococcus sp.]